MKLMDKYIEERGDSHVWDNFLDYTLEVRINLPSLHTNHGLRGTLMHLNCRLGHCRGLDSVRFVHDDGLSLQLNLHLFYVAFGESIQIFRDPPPGHAMTFPQALKMLSCNFGALIAVPAWVPGLFVP